MLIIGIFDSHHTRACVIRFHSHGLPCLGPITKQNTADADAVTLVTDRRFREQKRTRTSMYCVTHRMDVQQDPVLINVHF